MRQQLNENPRVQIIVLAIVGVIAAVLLFSTVLKKESVADPGAGAAAPAGATAPIDTGTESGAPADPAAAADPAATADPTATATDPAATTPVTPTDPSGDLGSADGLLASKGLPKDVLVAYANNEAIALFVYDPEGLSDNRVDAFVQPLRSRNDVKVFDVKIKDIGDYSRITSGVSVNRVPALIVVRPRKLSEGAPTASVSYGFRGPKSVDQAIRDALYDGRSVTAYP